MKDHATGGIPETGPGFSVGPPVWGEWAAALDRAGRDGEPDPALLVEECLLTCIRTGDGEPLDLAEFRRLDAGERDLLLTAAMAAMDRQRLELDLRLAESPESATVTGVGVGLRLRSWTFGERNDALRLCLSASGGRVHLDLAAYERAMVISCTTTERGNRLLPTTVEMWPVPVGEMVTAALNRLNGLATDYMETLSACIESGVQHPDLTVLYLAQTFGWTPDQVQRLDAGTVERLLAAMQVLQSRSPGPHDAVAGPTGPAEGVTRILVHDN